ncbi:MAG: lipoyl synthase [Deltaproteobacteria bacterium]
MSLARLPSWFQQKIPDPTVIEISRMLSGLRVNTVCRQARCPNLSRCFKSKEITFMILGDICTRQCRFCAVKKSYGPGRDVIALTVDRDEPSRVASAINALGIGYAVITSVTRDDIPDGGAEQFALTLKSIHAIGTSVKTEVLIPDFKGSGASLRTVLEAGPQVLGHNIETVERLYGDLKPQSNYKISLGVLRTIKKIKPGMITKSAMLLGLGETEQEVIDTIRDLKDSGCDIVVLGQYLAPSPEHYPVKNFIAMETFQKYRDIAMAMGLRSVLSDPLARSSYGAGKLYGELMHA